MAEGPADTTADAAARPPSSRHGGGRLAAAWCLLRALRREVFSDHLLMIAAGLALHGLLGALPALALAAALWGMVGDLSALQRTVAQVGGFLPDEAVGLIGEFVTDVPEGFGGGVALGVSLVVALWAAQRGAGGLITALNIVHDTVERRGRLRRMGVALLVALGGMTLLLLTLALLAVPPLLRAAWPDLPLLRLVSLGRWPALVLLFALGLGLLFRFAPSRERPERRWLSWGAVTGTLLWIAASYGLSLYVSHVASFGRLYGSLGAVVVVLLWFYLTAVSVLTGAEINALLSQRRPGEGRCAGPDAQRALRARERRTPP